MTTAAHAGSTPDRYLPFQYDTVGHESGGTLVVLPPTAPAGSAAPVSAAPTRPAGPGSDLLGTIRIRVTGAGSAVSTFVGIVQTGGAVLVTLAARRAGDRR